MVPPSVLLGGTKHLTYYRVGYSQSTEGHGVVGAGTALTGDPRRHFGAARPGSALRGGADRRDGLARQASRHSGPPDGLAVGTI